MPVTPKTYPNSHVFVNKLGIKDSQELINAETEFSTLQYEAYRLQPLLPTFNLDHLKAIHKQLFGDVYSWAGELREHDIRKGICEFTPHDKIEYYANEVYAELKQENFLNGLSLDTIVKRLTYYYDLTNRLHPFPEGNGRTQRLFIEHLASMAGFSIDWSLVQSWQIIEIAEQSFKGNKEPTLAMFKEITTPT